MKVKNCEKCKYYARRVWSGSYWPANYHRVGIAHAYGFCMNYNKRCSEVKKCQFIKEK